MGPPVTPPGHPGFFGRVGSAIGSGWHSLNRYVVPYALAFAGYGEYRRMRSEGHGVLSSLGTTLWNYGVNMAPPVIGFTMTTAAVRGSMRHTYSNLNRSRSAAMNFGVWQKPDMDAAAASSNALYQSAMASNSAMSMTGRSWAGMESAILHRKYG